MAIRAFLLVLCYFSYYPKVQGDHHRKLSRKEEWEIEKQLKLLNKPALKTIKAKGGDVYDCIDFYKQPAFDHPLLKNHTYHFQMRPSYRPYKMMNRTKYSMNEKNQVEIGLKGEGCPIGTVPIRRITKEDLIRGKLLFAHKNGSRFDPLSTKIPELSHAMLRTSSFPKKKYNGAGAVISVYQPTVIASQYSSAQITIRNGPDTIKIGWTVNPSVYGDSKTRLFTFFQAGSSSCFDTRCPGFVIVNTQIPLGAILLPISHRGGPIYNQAFFIYRDKFSGNWWLEFGRNQTPIGFWPQRIFSGLKDLATYIEWGGEAYGPLYKSGPPMGSGSFLAGQTDLDAYCEMVTTVNEAHDPVDADDVEDFTEDRNFYEIDDWGIRGEYGHVMTFGGPGAA